jgi:excisionase family DNA binding protein
VDEELITSGELAKRLGVTVRAIGKWAASGQITPAVTTPGGRYRWRWADVDRQLREQQERGD